jgi:hypothetical protein
MKLKTIKNRLNSCFVAQESGNCGAKRSDRGWPATSSAESKPLPHFSFRWERHLAAINSRKSGHRIDPRNPELRKLSEYIIATAENMNENLK